MDNKLIKVLTKNAIKCLMCNTILESKYRHNYVKCHCPNETFNDGGLNYQRVGGKDLNLIEDLCEYQVMTQEDYDNLIKQTKAKQLAKNEQGVKDDLLLKMYIIRSLYDSIY